MDKDFNFLISLWKSYNNASSLLIEAMNGTANEVGEFAERLVAKYYNAEQLTASHKSADLRTSDNKLIQVKSRKLKKLETTSLNVIRSWDFDILVVVLFTKDGNILKAIEINVNDAQKISKSNELQNGYVITTNTTFLNHPNSKDITDDLQAIINGKIIDRQLSLMKRILPKDSRENSVINNRDFELEFVPNDEKLFKQELLRTKKAKRFWFYSNGNVIDDTWDANNFTSESNLRGNINSNNKIRHRNETGLIKLKLEIVD